MTKLPEVSYLIFENFKIFFIADAGLMDDACFFHSDKSVMPGFVGIAGDGLLILFIAEDKSVFPRIVFEPAEYCGGFKIVINHTAY